MIFSILAAAAYFAIGGAFAFLLGVRGPVATLMTAVLWPVYACIFGGAFTAAYVGEVVQGLRKR